MNVLLTVAVLLADPHWFTRPEWVIVWVTSIYTVVSFLALIAIGVQVWLAKDTARRQLRAYVAVVIGEATYQEKDKDLYFAARPQLVNNGQTPAHKIQFKVRAAILAIPLPKETGLPETGDAGVGETILGIQHTANMSALVDGFCKDEEVEAIKLGSGARGLYVWGLVTYEDVFGQPLHPILSADFLDWGR